MAYHIAAVLPVEVAEREERRLLGHYLQLALAQGLDVPDPEEAWAQCRAAAVYGYYLRAITRRVDPAITNVFVARLGARSHGATASACSESEGGRRVDGGAGSPYPLFEIAN